MPFAPIGTAGGGSTASAPAYGGMSGAVATPWGTGPPDALKGFVPLPGGGNGAFNSLAGTVFGDTIGRAPGRALLGGLWYRPYTTHQGNDSVWGYWCSFCNMTVQEGI